MRAQLLRLDHALRAWVVAHRIAWLDQPIFLLSAAGLFGGVWVFIALILALFRRFLWRDFGRLVLVLIVTTVVTVSTSTSLPKSRHRNRLKRARMRAMNTHTPPNNPAALSRKIG